MIAGRSDKQASQKATEEKTEKSKDWIPPQKQNEVSTKLVKTEGYSERNRKNYS